MGGGLGGGGAGNAGGLTSGFSLTSLTGTGTSGTGGGGGGYRAGSGSTSYGSTSFLGSYYANPFAMGMPSSSGTNAPSGTQSFGQALYNITTGTSTTGRGGRGGATFGSTGTGTISRGATGTNATNFTGASSLGTYRNPTYYVVLDRSLRPALAAAAPPAQIQATVQQSLARSTQFLPGAAVKVEMDGAVLVLKGTVADEQDRRHAEAVARLTPGVRQVRNELVTRETTAARQ
jgi:hypothetical protein